MKTIRTQRGHERVTLRNLGGKPEGSDAETVTFGRDPLEVSDEHADQYVMQAAALGISLSVVDGAPDTDNTDTGQVIEPPAAVTGDEVGETATDDPTKPTKPATSGTTKGK